MGAWAEIGRCLPVHAQHLCCVNALHCGPAGGRDAGRMLAASDFPPGGSVLRGCSLFPAASCFCPRFSYFLNLYFSFFFFFF